MKKKLLQNIIEKIYNKINLLEELTMSLLNFNFVVIYIIQKMLVSLRNLLNFVKGSIFECFFKEYKRLNFY